MSGPSQELPGGFSRRTVTGIATAATASFALALLLMVFGADLGRPPSPDANTFSRSALGHRALVELLESVGLGVLPRQLRAGVGTGPQTPLLVAEPQPQRVALDATRRLNALVWEARRRGAPLIVALPKWRGDAREDRPGWLTRVELLPREEVGDVLAALTGAASGSRAVLRRAGGTLRCTAAGLGGGEVSVQLEPIQLLPPSAGLEPVVRCTGGLLVASVAGSGGEEGAEILIVADPDLLNNHGIGRRDHAGVVVGLMVDRLGATGVVIDETIHGFVRSGGLLAELLRFPLVLAVIHGLALATVVLWAGSGRLGKPLGAGGAPAAGKRVLIENTARLLTARGEAAESLRRYFQQTVRAVAGRLFLPESLSPPATLRRLGELSRGRGTAADPVLLDRRLQRLSREERPDEARVLALALQLHRWREEMTHGLRDDR